MIEDTVEQQSLFEQLRFALSNKCTSFDKKPCIRNRLDFSRGNRAPGLKRLR